MPTPKRKPRVVAMSWAEVEAAVALLRSLLILNYGLTFTHVMAVARGGLVPAAMLAQELGVRAVASVQCIGYRDMTKLEHTNIVGQLPSVPNAGTTLVVDDIVDTGATLRCLRQVFPHATFASLVARRPHEGLTSAVTPKPADAWVRFPWER